MTNKSQKRLWVWFVSDEINCIRFITGSERCSLTVIHASLLVSLINNFLNGDTGAWTQYKWKCNHKFTNFRQNLPILKKKSCIGDSSRFGMKLLEVLLWPLLVVWFWLQNKLSELLCHLLYLPDNYHTRLSWDSNK